MENDDYNATEYMRERMALMEIDGGLKRHQAEFYAMVATWRFCERTGRVHPDDHRYRLTARNFTGNEPREPGENMV